MDILYAPWRGDYVTTQNKKIDGCLFCHIAKTLDDDENLCVLYRENDFFIIMNKYPYAPAHFMIIPNLHTNNLENLDPKIWSRMCLFAQRGVKMLKEVVNAQGVNIGMNLGQAGGASITEHIHLHLVPRWSADANFITIIANTRVYSIEFDYIYKKLKENISKYFKDI
jgi:diadenosine tetraphosphate (Ap4A) HIT family hydrolase